MLDKKINSDISNAIDVGIKRGKRNKRRLKIININIIVIALVFVVFSVSVNLSGTFASAVEGIPVIGKIAKLVRIGSGYTEVAKRGYFSEGEVLLEDDEYTISIEGYYYSDKSMNILVKLEGDLEDNYNYSLRNVKLLNNDVDWRLYGSKSYGIFERNNGYGISSIIVLQREDLLPEDITLNFDIIRTTGSKDEILYKGVSTTLNRQLVEKHMVISVAETLKSEEIDITIDTLKITPTVMELVIKVNSESMVYYGFDAIYLESNSKKYMPISNGTTATMDIENGVYTYFFESNYFDTEKDLSLVLDGLYALPVDNSKYVIDLDTMQTISGIDDNLVMEKIEENDNRILIYFKGTNDLISFKAYNDNHFDSEMRVGSGEYILTLNKEIIENNIVEISFYKYPAKVEFNHKLTIAD